MLKHRLGMEQIIQTSNLAENNEVDEGRRERRQRVLKTGRIIINNDASSINVVIKDLSDGGARLSLVDPWILPVEFSLVILNPNVGSPERRACQRRWQKGNMIGVEFVETNPAVDTRKKNFFAN